MIVDNWRVRIQVLPGSACEKLVFLELREQREKGVLNCCSLRRERTAARKLWLRELKDCTKSKEVAYVEQQNMILMKFGRETV